eukprot:835515-Amphidinium_carterae.1
MNREQHVMNGNTSSGSLFMPMMETSHFFSGEEVPMMEVDEDTSAAMDTAEHDIAMFSEHAVKDAMNKEFPKLINKNPFKEVDSMTLTPQQLRHVVATKLVITQRPTNN